MPCFRLFGLGIKHILNDKIFALHEQVQFLSYILHITLYGELLTEKIS